MIVLALDLGTTTGWALGGAGKVFAAGTESFKPGRWEGGGMRYLRFRRWLFEVLAAGNLQRVGEVYFEEVRRHAGTDAAHVYGGLLGQLTAVCEELSLPYQGVPVGTIKRHVTGKGNADKAAVIAGVRALTSFETTDDNEADAIALCHFVLTEQLARAVA